MTDPRLTAALAKLPHGGWSLTVGGFARKAVGIRRETLTPAERRDLTALMHATGLPHRRVSYGGDMIDVWDHEAP